MSVIANCPSCGGQVEFRIDTSFVTVCEFCSTAVARSDRGLEDRGKVVDLIDSASPLDLWLEGRYEGTRFQLVGRTQIRHSAGGVWDEWYCAFDDDRWGWLSEAQGQFTMSFVAGLEKAPGRSSLRPGLTLPNVGGGMVVTEIGEAEVLGAKGEIPYLLESGKKYSYADLSGKEGAFGTLDYGDSPATLYVGKQVTLDEVGISASAPPRDESAQRAQEGAKVSAHALECPNCRGSLELIAPDECERVACPYCAALCDVQQGTLKVLQILDKERFPDPPLALGKTGVFEGHQMVVCGYMVRSSVYEGEVFYWDEYLLYDARVGFRWLVESDGHWSYIEPVAAADVSDASGVAHYEGRAFREFDNVRARVEFVLGQFYWKVEPGERVAMRDFTSPPYTLSCEQTKKEITWSKGTYLPTAEVEKRFGVTLPKATSGTVGLGQPYPYAGIFKGFTALVVLALAVFIYGAVSSGGTIVLKQSYDFPSGKVVAEQVVFSDSFDLRRNRNLEVEAFSRVDNSWVYLQFDLINNRSGGVTSFDLPIEFYSGVDWKEGSPTSSKVLASPGTGNYQLRVSNERKNTRLGARVDVVVREGIVRIRYFLVLLGLLGGLPLLAYFDKRGFEIRRWSDSSQASPWDSED